MIKVPHISLSTKFQYRLWLPFKFCGCSMRSSSYASLSLSSSLSSSFFPSFSSSSFSSRLLHIYQLKKTYSFIGQQPIHLESSIDCKIIPISPNLIDESYKKTPFHQLITLTGPKGSLNFKIPIGLKAIKDTIALPVNPMTGDANVLSSTIATTTTDSLNNSTPKTSMPNSSLSIPPASSPSSKTILRILKDDNIEVNQSLTTKQKLFVKAMWGTSQRILLKQAVGVNEGHHVILRLVGVGYRAKIENNSIILKLGYSHLIQVPIPDGITVQIPTPNKIILEGIDLHQLTQFASKIRSKRKPEPYNGKGIFVDNETIIRKQGKKK